MKKRDLDELMYVPTDRVLISETASGVKALFPYEQIEDEDRAGELVFLDEFQERYLVPEGFAYMVVSRGKTELFSGILTKEMVRMNGALFALRTSTGELRTMRFEKGGFCSVL